LSSPLREGGIVRFPAPLSPIRLTISGVTLRQEPTQVMVRKLKKRRELPAKQKCKQITQEVSTYFEENINKGNYRCKLELKWVLSYSKG